MNPAIFRKGDASSVLVVDKTWEDIIDKPDFFDSLAQIIVSMTDAAVEEVDKKTTLRNFKEAINRILIRPLSDTPAATISPMKKEGTILVDAFWDEIRKSSDKWEKLHAALEKAWLMKQKIDLGTPLTVSDTLQESKNNFNEAIVKPLLGINDDE